MPREIIAITHGVATSANDARWMEAMEAYLTNRARDQGKDVVVLIHRYNPFFARIFRYIQTFSHHWRDKQVRDFQKYIAWVRQSFGLNATIHVLAHSFGAYKVIHAAIQDTGQPRAFYGQVILFGAAVSSRLRPRELEGHVGQIHNYFSKGDDVLPLSPFGQAGWKGFAFADGELIVNHDCSPLRHSDYFNKGLLQTYMEEVGGILFG